jgi:hypothetical protein
MSAIKPEGKPPWITGYLTAILLGVALSAYSIIQKRDLLVRSNALIVTVVQCVVVLIAYIIDSKSVADAIFGTALVASNNSICLAPDHMRKSKVISSNQQHQRTSRCAGR